LILKGLDARGFMQTWPASRVPPAQRARLIDIHDNLIACIAEAEREGWIREVDDLKVSLVPAEDKRLQLDCKFCAVTLGPFAPRVPRESIGDEAALLQGGLQR
jgi:hypothetical protein